MTVFSLIAEAIPKAAANAVLTLSNDVDVLSANVATQLTGITRIDLAFPAFTDGRAFSQARLLRERLGFAGDIRATGDVGIDQLLQMKRCGFSSAVLPEGADVAAAVRQLKRYGAFYQHAVQSKANPALEQVAA